MLSTVSGVLTNYPAPHYVSYVSAIILTAWSAFWIATVSYMSKFEGGGGTVLTLFLLLSFYWTVQVVKNVVHVTTAGMVASWYFFAGSPQGMPSNPTMGALKRATTTSFGSIAFGSLLVAIIQVIRQLLNRAAQDSRLACFVQCILGWIESLFRIFNQYAFAQVAIYGKSYCDAARDTWALVKSNGVDAIINDSLISGVLLMGAFLGGAFTAIIGSLFALALIPSQWYLLGVFAFIIGMSVTMLSMEVIESAVCTVFVSFALDSGIMQRNQPELYGQFISTFPGVLVQRV